MTICTIVIPKENFGSSIHEEGTGLVSCPERLLMDMRSSGRLSHGNVNPMWNSMTEHQIPELPLIEPTGCGPVSRVGSFGPMNLRWKPRDMASGSSGVGGRSDARVQHDSRGP